MLNLAYRYGVRPLLFSLDPEAAHHFAIATCHRISESPILQAIAKSTFYYNDSRLSQTLWNLKFENPVGLAAGFDKNAEAIGAWEHLGFGFLAMFRSVRFICFIFLAVCFFMLLSGIAFLKTSTE